MDKIITLESDLIVWRGHFDGEPGTYKLILVPRFEIDEGSDEPDPWDLLWIDEGNVRRYECRLDTVAGRLSSAEAVQASVVLGSAPEAVREAVAGDFMVAEILLLYGDLVPGVGIARTLS